MNQPAACEWRIQFIKIVFFQAEDGIRDLVRSRGLGDVYKRQKPANETNTTLIHDSLSCVSQSEKIMTHLSYRVVAVSYTHLTLPTSDLV